MSHSQTVQVKVKSVAALREAANDPSVKSVDTDVKDIRMYDGKVYRGMTVSFNDWRYPVVFLEDGSAAFDNYNGHWGKIDILNRFVQRYSKCAAKQAAIAEGMSVESEYQEGTALHLNMRSSDGASVVKMKFPETGDASVEVECGQGTACTTLTAGISAALGTTTSQQLNNDYYERERAQVRETE